jgi:RimJ/RimL family protein N-acetyltransferase
MESKEISMSIEEFELMKRPFGWKVEYWDGKARLSPREYHVWTKLELEHRKIDESCQIVPIDLSFKEQAIATFFEAFQDSVEFCNWTTESIRTHAQKNINNYFQGVRGKPLPVSQIALEPNSDRLIGLALFVEKKEANVELDLLFVKPPYQRTGIATQMVTSGINTLLEDGVQELRSAYHICNEDSHNWHQKYGFKDIPEQFYCRLKYSWYRQEIWRQEKLGEMNNLEELQTERDRWYDLLQEDWQD